MRVRAAGLVTVLFLIAGEAQSQASVEAANAPFVVVLGIAQDGGYPQAGCRKECCRKPWADPSRRAHVASLAIVDPAGGRRWLVDATPDFREQLHRLDGIAPAASSPGLDGILLTHAHIGHYTGLMQLGREVIGAHGVSVFAMPRMRKFLETSGPWDQLIRLGNIELKPLEAGRAVPLSERISVTPLAVPHRDEYSETVGFVIAGPKRSVLYLPDIDKWEKWKTPLEEALSKVSVAYLDGTFYGEGEIPGRDMSEIPHPFMTETLSRLARLPMKERAKVRFIHLNHTNPALDPKSEAAQAVDAAGAGVAIEGDRWGI
jgi:pyrroloquinoline quinone biosynthesis protein B